MAPSRKLSLTDLEKMVKQGNVSIAWLTAALFQTMVTENISFFESLRVIIAGGDILPLTTVNMLAGKYPDLCIINGYGPTENTTFTCCYEVDRKKLSEYINVPIGVPISNTQVYIVDTNNRLSPIGIANELCIAGAGLAEGYLHNPELTAEKFIDNPFGEGKLYRTGDLARWLPDGNVEFLGRIDNQVKIRGYRIELGEVESVLQQSAYVKQAVVLAKADHIGSNNLVAYIISEEGYEKETLLVYMQDRLPEYMVPSIIMQIDELPLTPNGKVNKKALPEPDIATLTTNEYVAPRNETEQRLAAIWQELLQVEKAGVHDNFFELGGHSLLATQVVSVIRKEMEIELAIKDLFAHATISGLAELISKQSKGLLLPLLTPQVRPGEVPLSFAQERLWFIDRLEGSVHYHIPYVLKLEGDLDVTVLQQAFSTILERHESLRTVFKEENGQAWQEVMPVDNWVLHCEKTTPHKKQYKQLIASIINHPFDLSQDYMLRVHLVRLSGQKHVLVLVMHHIASDGWSMPIFVREFMTAYRALKENLKPTLPSLPIQYADYALWQRHYLEGEALNRQLGYWQEKLQDADSLNLPTDYPRPAIQSTKGDRISFRIDKKADRSIASPFK